MRLAQGQGMGKPHRREDAPSFEADLRLHAASAARILPRQFDFGHTASQVRTANELKVPPTSRLERRARPCVRIWGYSRPIGSNQDLPREVESLIVV